MNVNGWEIPEYCVPLFDELSYYEMGTLFYYMICEDDELLEKTRQELCTEDKAYLIWLIIKTFNDKKNMKG